MRQLARHRREWSQSETQLYSGLMPDYRPLVLTLSSAVRYRSRIAFIWFGRIDFPPNDDDPTYTRFFPHCARRMVVWDRIRRDRWGRSVVAVERSRCQRWLGHLERRFSKL